MRTLFLSALLPVCLLFGCGDEATDDPGTAPTLSDLSLDAEPMGTVGQVLNINGSVVVADPDGDIANMLIDLVLPNGMSQSLPPQAIGAPAGQNMVAARFVVAVQPPVPGTYRVELRMDDAQGNVSEPLSFDVPVE